MDPQSQRKLAYRTFDVFTETRFAGNPLAVVEVPAAVDLTQEEKQIIAREFNYSETIILQTNDQKDPADAELPEWKIGIFLTNAEIPFAGHPTIGTACYLGAQLQAARPLLESQNEPIRGNLIAKAGPIPFTYDPASKTSSILVPQNFHRHEKVLTIEEAEFHGLAPKVIQNMVHPPPFVSLVKGMTFILVELPSLEILGEVQAGLKEANFDGQLDTEWHPDGTFTAFAFFVRLGKSPDGSTKLRSRIVFGTTEDPATGAASCALVAYLSLHHPDKETVAGPRKFEITQGVEMGRESHILLNVTLDDSETRVQQLMLGGSAVQVMEGSITL